MASWYYNKSIDLLQAVLCVLSSNALEGYIYVEPITRITRSLGDYSVLALNLRQKTFVTETS